MKKLEQALEKGKCPFCGFQLYGKAGQVVCEYDECDFIIAQSRVKEILGHNPYGFVLKPLRCKENYEWTDKFGVVRTDTHDWHEVDSGDHKIQRLKCTKCEKISDATNPLRRN